VRLPATAAATATTTTASAAAVATTTAAAGTSTTTATTARLVLRLIHAQWTSAHVVTIEVLDSAGGIGLAHLDKTEAAGATGLAIGGQRYRFYRSVL
jgi:hypothetical protein